MFLQLLKLGSLVVIPCLEYVYCSTFFIVIHPSFNVKDVKTDYFRACLNKLNPPPPMNRF